MFLHLPVSLFIGRGVSVCPRLSLSMGVSIQGVSVQGGLCPGMSLFRGSLSREGSLSKGVSVQGGLCPGRGSLSREGVSVQGGGLCPGRGSLSRGVSVQGGLYPGRGLSGDPLYFKEQVVRILLECFLVDLKLLNEDNA